MSSVGLLVNILSNLISLLKAVVIQFIFHLLSYPNQVLILQFTIFLRRQNASYSHYFSMSNIQSFPPIG